MGTYFNPPQKLPEVARKLTNGSYQELVDQLKDGEELFGHYDRFMFQNAVYLYSESEFNEFEGHVRDCTSVRLGFYAMPENEFQKIIKY